MKAEYRISLENGATTPWKSMNFPAINFNDIAPDWDFIMSFYDGYHNSTDVAYSNDLHCCIHKEKPLSELKNMGIKSISHAAKELDRIDKVLMKQALSDFMKMVVSGEVQFRIPISYAV